MTPQAAASESGDARPGRSLYPSGIPFIIGNEAAERFSYYGMRAILYMYLTQLFLLSRGEAPGGESELAAEAGAYGTEVVHLFFAGAYLFPLLGAIVADRLLGKYNVILWVSLLYCVGHGALAVAGRLTALGEYGGAEAGVYLGLVLIALGSGGIKPCVSANMGDQFSAKNSDLVTKVFQIFYFIVNFGSFFSTLITPLLYRYVSPEVAFGVPGVLMGLATLVFWFGRHRFRRVPPSPGGRIGLLDSLAATLLLSPIFALIFGYFVMWSSFEPPEGLSGTGLIGPIARYYAWLIAATVGAVVLGFALFGLRQKKQEDTGFLAMLLYAVRHRKERQPGQGFFDPARARFGEEAGDGPPAVLKIILVFSMVSVFWALFDQHSTTWLAQAREMDLALRVPTLTWYATLAGVAVLTLYGGAWLFLHVSNVQISRKIHILVVCAVIFAIGNAGFVDVIRGGMKTVQLQYSQVAALNPVMVMLIIPLFNVGIWSPLAKRGIEVRPITKMTLGMFIAALSFVGAALVQGRVETLGSGEVHVLWQVPQYFLLTAAEVLVSVTGLEFAYAQAPRAMKSTIVGFWQLTVTFGNLIVAFLADLQTRYELSRFFWLFAALMTAAAVVFTIMAYFYKGKTYLQEE